MKRNHSNNHLEGIIHHDKRKLEKMLYEIVEKHMKDMVFIMKVENEDELTYVFVNEQGLNQPTLPKDLIGKRLEEVVAKEVAGPLKAIYQKVITTKDTYKYEDEFFLANGDMVSGESILTPIFNENGKVSYIVTVTRDISQSVVERKIITESEQRYRSIVEQNLDGILTVNMDGIILNANPVAKKMLRLPTEEIINKDIYSFIEEDKIPIFTTLFARTRVGHPSDSFNNHFLINKEFNTKVQIKTIPIVIDKNITGIYIVLKDVTELSKSVEKIKFMADHDQLTGLLNRRALITSLEELVSYSQENNQEFALLTIDLDRFKYLNDTLGHLVGDQVLVGVADRLSDYKLRGCSVYRQGGDEFNVVIPNCNRQFTTKIAQKILQTFSKPFFLQSQEYYISPSIGISMYPNDGKDVPTLLKSADEALYRVKEKGKAHFQFYRADMLNAKIFNIVDLETKLRKALEKNELILYYQPQIDLKTGDITSFEALIRWNSTELGFIAPNDFIPIAEDTGLIIPIGDWVIETACQQIKEWSTKFKKDYRIAVNISPKQFQQRLLTTIKNSLERNDIKPHLLEIEITEGAMQDIKDAIPILDGLKQLGVSISIDDFGTGYSSLGYIKLFPINILKIDQSFVRDVIENKKDAAITTTIIHLAKNLGMEVIAEGVENQDQAKFLLDADCNLAQGFLFSKPLPPRDIENIFRGKL